MTTHSANPNLHSVDSEHPCLGGHFPGEPIVPGVVILNTVATDFHQQFPRWKIAGVRKLKFLQPLLPQAKFSLVFGAIKNDTVRFKCLLDTNETPLAEGNLKLQNITAEKAL